MDFKTDGFLVIQSLLSKEVRSEALRRVQAIHAAGLAKGEYSPRVSTEAMIPVVFSQDPWFLGLLDSPLLDEVLGPILDDPTTGEPGHNYIIASMSARSSGKAIQGLHIDSRVPSTGSMAWMAVAAIALEDRGKPEGCTYLVPGSHLSGAYPERRKEAKAVPLKAGDAVIWDGRMWHGALPRTSESMGWTILITFQQWWVKQKFDIPGAISPEVKSTLTPRQVRLLGFNSIPPAIEA